MTSSRRKDIAVTFLGVKQVLSFYVDEYHPYPYLEGHSVQGVEFSFYAPLATRYEKKQYEHKVRNERDVVKLTWLQ